jgi:hypothetical protein
MATPYPLLYQVRDSGLGTPDLATIWDGILKQGDDTELARLRASGWVQGADGQSGTLTRVGTYDFGTFALPPVGNLDRAIRVCLHVSAYTTGGLTYRAQVVRAFVPMGGTMQLLGWAEAGELTDIATPTGTGWSTLDLTLPPAAPNGMLGVRITGTAASAPNQAIGSVCILSKPATTVAEGDASITVPTTWPPLSITAAGTAQRPDDVYTAERIRLQQHHVLTRYPRTLAAHQFGTNAGGNAAFTPLKLRYRIYRGPQAGTVTFKLKAKTSTAAHSTAQLYVDPAGSGGSTAIGSAVSITNTTSGAYVTLTASSGWTANAYHDVEIWLQGVVHGDGTTYDTATVYEVVAYESEYAQADFVLSGDTAPTRYLGSYAASFSMGDPIVADYASGTRQALHGDRATLARNACFQGWRRSALLLNDHLDRDATTGRNSTDQQYLSTGGTVLWDSAHVTSYGAAAIEARVQIRRVRGVASTADEAQANAQAIPRLGLWLNVAEAVTLDVTDTILANGRTYVAVLPLATVTEATVYSMQLQAGWVDALTGAALDGATDSIVVEGVTFRELPRGDAPTTDYLLTEGSDHLELEDGSGSLILDT